MGKEVSQLTSDREMKKTGIFYHPSYSQRSFLTIGRRLADFPHIIKHILEKPNVILFEPDPVSEELLLKIHTPQMIREVKRHPLCTTAWHSAGGVVEAGEMIWQGVIYNAFVFIGAGGHHSGWDYFGGACCFNDVALCIYNLRDAFGVRRFAILDTDAHHGDGTREIFFNDPDVLHVCFCGTDYVSSDGTKVDVDVYSLDPYGRDIDDKYVGLVNSEFIPRARDFKPDFLFWYFGYDTHRGEYGDIGLTVKAYEAIADLMIGISEELCSGRLEVVLAGGASTEIANQVIPPVIERIVRT